MKPSRLIGLVAFALLGAGQLLAAAPGRAAEAQAIVIGTGSTAGVYFHVGRAICRLVKRHVEGVDCTAVATPGSLSNLGNLSGGAIEIGLAQSDWQFHAVNGSGPFEFMDAGFGGLRALFSVHSEPFTLVARRDSGIQKLDDLKGRRVNIGSPGSGQRATMAVVMAAKGWRKADFRLAEEMSAREQSLALCHGRIEAMIYTVGHPNDSVGKAVGLCDARLVQVGDADIDRLVAEHPYYAYTTIPGGMYPGNPDPVRTFGVKATVMTSADVDAELIYAVVKAVFDNLDRFRKLHPALGGLEARRMVREGLSAPLHEGALRYYNEKRLR